LTESQFTEPQLTESQLTKSQLTESQLTKSQLTESQLTKSQLTESQSMELPVLTGPERYQGHLSQQLVGHDTHASSQNTKPGY
jgi:uncharacterized protein YjbI with pentapeptide repeats